MGMWNQIEPKLGQAGIDNRVPRVSARYYNPGLEAGRLSGKGGESFGRGAIATLRLLNVKDQTGLTDIERLILKEIGGPDSNGMTSMFVQNVSFRDDEKSMVMQTFGDDYAVYFFGRAPRTMNISAVLLDDPVNNWFYKFMVAYDKFLRGTKVAKNFRIISLSLPNADVLGTIMGMGYSQNASNDSLINVDFSILVKDYRPISAADSTSLVDSINGTNALFNKAVLSSELPTLSKSDIAKRTGPIVSSSAYAFSAGLQTLDGGSISTTANLGGQITIGGSASTVYMAYQPRATFVMGPNGDLTDPSSLVPKAPDSYFKSPKSFPSLGSAVQSYLKGIEKGLKSATDAFNGGAKAIADFVKSTIVGTIKKFLDPVTSLLSAVNGMLDSVKNIVTTVESSIDAAFAPFVQLAQDINQTKRNLQNTIGTITNMPHTLSDKLSNNLRLVKFKGVASLGSKSAGISSDTAHGVLSKTNTQDATSLSIVGKTSSASANTESRVLAL